MWENSSTPACLKRNIPLLTETSQIKLVFSVLILNCERTGRYLRNNLLVFASADVVGDLEPGLDDVDGGVARALRAHDGRTEAAPAREAPLHPPAVTET